VGRKKAIVSACLLGEYVRYDGTTKANNAVIEALKDYEIIPFCPEDPVMGTPRERISVIEVDGRQKIFTDSSGVEVTTALMLQAQLVLDQHHDADIVVLKSKSPSCGLGTTPVLNTDREEIKKGSGVAAELFVKAFKGKVFDEHSIMSHIKGQG